MSEKAKLSLWTMKLVFKGTIQRIKELLVQKMLNNPAKSMSMNQTKHYL